jgi:hypothetical protein
MFKISLKEAQKSASICSGVNEPNLESLTPENVISIRKEFLLNVAYNGKSSHRHIIAVLEYMSQYCEN